MGILGLAASAFLVGLTGAMMPGPMLTVTLDRSAKQGWIAGPLVVLGHVLLELLLVSAIVLGFGTVLSVPVFTGSIGVVGGIVLAWLGIDIVRNAGRVQLGNSSSSETTPGSTPFGTVLSGLSTSISNPYWLLWWGTVGTGYITLAMSQGTIGLLAFLVGHGASDFVWFSAVALVMANGGHLVPASVFTAVLRVLGLFLVATAAYFAYSGAVILSGL